MSVLSATCGQVVATSDDPQAVHDDPAGTLTASPRGRSSQLRRPAELLMDGHSAM